MALYSVQTRGLTLLVRAENGARAREIVNDPDGKLLLIDPIGEAGVIAEMIEAECAEEDDEEDITNMSDKRGTRRLRNRSTGRIRTVISG